MLSPPVGVAIERRHLGPIEHPERRSGAIVGDGFTMTTPGFTHMSHPVCYRDLMANDIGVTRDMRDRARDPLARPPGRTPAMSVRLPTDLRDRVSDVAGDRPIGSVIREALVLWLEVQPDDDETEAQSA